MALWRERMPADIYLRSGTDWHLDASGEHTFEAYLEDRGLQHVPAIVGDVGVVAARQEARL